MIPVWPVWANFWILGSFSKPLATINFPKSPTFLGNFCKGVKIFNFFWWNHFWTTFIDIWCLFLVTLERIEKRQQQHIQKKVLAEDADSGKSCINLWRRRQNNNEFFLIFLLPSYSGNSFRFSFFFFSFFSPRRKMFKIKWSQCDVPVKMVADGRVTFSPRWEAITDLKWDSRAVLYWIKYVDGIPFNVLKAHCLITWAFGCRFSSRLRYSRTVCALEPGSFVSKV